MDISWKYLDLQLAVPFRTAKAVRSNKQTVWVRLDHDGVQGWGEAVPMDTYGQTLESAVATLETIRSNVETAINPYERVATTWALIRRFPDQLATVTAIDVAMHDWLGKKLGVPVTQLLGIPAKGHPATSYSIGIDEPARMAELAAAHLQYPVFKLKVGGADDIAALEAIRQVAPDHRIRVDGNCGWSVESAISALKILSEFNLEFVEQPLSVSATADDWRRVREAVDIPLMADESCVILADVPQVAGHVDSINIKLGKCGGITPALAMIQLAKTLGLKVMIGCMHESGLAITAAAQLGALVDYLDLDGHVLLKDPQFGGLSDEEGILQLPIGPGLGLTPPSV